MRRILTCSFQECKCAIYMLMVLISQTTILSPTSYDIKNKEVFQVALKGLQVLHFLN